MKAMQKLMILLVLLSTGCAELMVGGATAVGTYAYVAGQLKKTYNANLEATLAATVSGCKSIGLPVLEESKQLSQASVKTKDGDRDVWITLKTQSSSTTEVAVRVGYLGDEVTSRRIHDAIGSKL